MSSNKKIKPRELIKNNFSKKNNLENIGESKESNQKFIDNTKNNMKSNFKNKNIKLKKISMSLTKKEENELDNYIEKSDNISIVVIVAILIVCFIVGISLGYILYRIAINGAI